MGEVSRSAMHAREMGYLKATDVIVFHPAELLHVAKAEARAMVESGHRPPLEPAGIPVLGDTGIATLRMMLVNMKEGGFISAHDDEIGTRIATILCGGAVEPGSLVDEKWLLDLERPLRSSPGRRCSRIERCSRPEPLLSSVAGKLATVVACLVFAVPFGAANSQPRLHRTVPTGRRSGCA
jgi:hypothetical protein